MTDRPVIADLHRLELAARRHRAEAIGRLFAALVRAVAGSVAPKGARRAA